MGWIANVENAGEFVAAEKGYYADEGVDLELVPGGPGVSVEPLVVSGKALVGLSQPDNVARARQQGAALKVVATTFQRNPAAIMSLETQPGADSAGSCRQEAGHPAVRRPDLRRVLYKHRDRPEVDHLCSGAIRPGPTGRRRGRCLRVVSDQPADSAHIAGHRNETFLLADYGFNLFTDAFEVAEESLADPERRATIVAILRATMRGWQDAIADPEAAAKLVVEKYGKSLNLDLEAQTLTMREADSAH